MQVPTRSVRLRMVKENWTWLQTQLTSTQPSPTQKRLKQQIQQTRFYAHTTPRIAADAAALQAATSNAVAEQKRRVFVQPLDSIECASYWAKRGHRPCVLNMASAVQAGGAWRKGAIAQEESLSYRTSQPLNLESHEWNQSRGWNYPIPSTGAVYYEATVLRNAQYLWMEEQDQFPMSFIAAAAVRKPKCCKGRLSDVDAEAMRAKIRSILRIAVEHGHDVMVLGAFGCGAYQNPPHHIAELFEHVLQENEFASCLPIVSFAILDTKGRSNLAAFSARFGPAVADPID